MTIHKEGYASIAVAALVLGVLNLIVFYSVPEAFSWISWLVLGLSVAFWLFIVSFFRIPSRPLTIHNDQIICPADGKVVVIEEAYDEEYFKAKRLQVSIFMSPANVHVNRHPVSGKVVYSQYHKGKYLVAWEPKSSTENERHSIVIDRNGKEVLVKQIAGAVARRIVNYCKAGSEARQGEELGFIKFGSRVDLLLPLGTKLSVEIGQHVKGGVTVLGEW